MSFKKKVTLTIMMMVSILCLIFGAVACSNGDSGDNGNTGGMSAKEAIERYILPQNQTLVDADFTLPKTIGSAESPITVEWKSDNTAAIAIEDKGENYNAKVTIQDEVTDVKLTISADGNSKDFTVRVDGFSVYTFLDNYNFPQRKTAVKKDFDLETETTYQGKKATISWAIDEKYSGLIALNETKNKVLVTPGEDVEEVEIEATFSYNGETATQKYPFSVAPELDHLQTVNRYYSVPDYPLELSGYIVHVVEASESYGNATFYMIDDDFCSGYYCYRVKIDTADIAKYVEGAHITVSGDTTKNYNGLWENNSGGTAVVDDTAKINPREKVYALDTDLLAGTPSTIYHESTFVSLSGWKVASKPDTKPTAADNNLFTLEKDGTKITVRITKYMQRTDAELAALCDVYDSVEEGDFVNVTGILGNYNGFQIQPVVASDITKATAESTNTDGAKVKAAVKAVNDAVAANFSSLIATPKEVEMPASVEDVAISYKVAGAKNPTVTIGADGTFNINPTTTEHNYDIQVTYKIGDYTGYSFFQLHNWKLSDKEIVANVKTTLEKLELSEVKRIGEYDFPEIDDLGTTITWAVKESSPSWVTIADGKIKVVFLPQQATTVTLIATIALNSESAQAEVALKVAADPMIDFVRLEEPEEGDYIFSAMHNEERLYASSLELDGNYIATTNDVEKAVELTIEKSGENWLIKMGEKYLEVNPYSNSTGGVSYNLRLVDTATAGAVWEWDDTIKIFKQKPVATEDGVTPADAYFYIGMRDDATFTTMSPSDIKYITGDNASKLDVTQHPSRFGELEKIAHRHYYEYAHTTNAWTHTGTCSQPGCDQKTVTEDCRPELNVCPKCGYVYPETEILTKLFALESGQSLLGTYKLTGSVKKIDTAYSAQYGNVTFTITIGDRDIQAFREKSDYSSTVKAGDTVTVTGALKNYNGTVEFDSGCAIIELVPGTTEPEPEPELPEGGTQSDPYTIAEALTVAKALASGAYSETAVYIKGFVVDAGSWSDQYGNWSSIYLADAKDAKKADGIQLYRLNPDATYLKLANDLTVGAEIIVCGYLQNYNGNTPEITSKSSTNVTVISYTDPRTVAEKIQAALNAVTLPDKLAADLDMPASTVTGVTLTYTSNNQAITVGESKFTVTRGATDVSVEITVSANAEGGTAQTKKLTVVVRASSSVLVSLSFADKDETRTSQSDEEQVWEQNGITFTNQKGSSTTKVGDYGNPVRVYANSSVKIEYTSAMTEIVFHCNSASYATALQKSLGEIEGATVTLSGSVVYVVFATARAEFEFTATAQLRFDSIEVVYSAGGAEPAGPGTSVTIPEAAQGTFTCVMAMKGEDEVDASSVAALVVTANSIKWGEKTVTILEGEGYNFLVEIDGKQYGLMFEMGAWSLGALDESGEMYAFANMAGGGAGGDIEPELSL